MARKRNGWVPAGEATPKARRVFTQTDQVSQLVSASEADADLGFMARTMALCSLPRSNPGNRLQYKRVNGPFKLVHGRRCADNKLPYGNLPRLLLGLGVRPKRYRTKTAVLVLGKSLLPSLCGNSVSTAAAAAIPKPGFAIK